MISTESHYHETALMGHEISPRVVFEKNVNKLAELLQKSKKPMDYFSISDALGFKTVDQVYSRHVFKNPSRAKRCVLGLLKRFPGQFEMTTVEKQDKRGVIYFAPAVRAIRGNK